MQTHGEIPKDLCYCVSWYDSPHFFIHGGRNRELSLSDTYFLDTDELVWRKVFTMEQPLSRFHHSAVKAEGKEVYIFGGCYIGKENRYLGDLHRYEYSNHY
jgi:N-acetylneuraminic acid mutarotase